MDSVTRWCTGRTPGASDWMNGWQLAKSTTTLSKKSSSSFSSSTAQPQSSITFNTSTLIPAPSSNRFFMWKCLMRAVRSSWLQKHTSIKLACYNKQEDDLLISPLSLPWLPLPGRNSPHPFFKLGPSGTDL